MNNAMQNLIDAILADVAARPEIYARFTAPSGTQSTVTVTDVDPADGRVYATNAIGLTLCLQPQQLTEIRFEPMKRVAKFMDAG